jgi:ubiquinone/menaquinone biosynthesis C-methylase UbiE
LPADVELKAIYERRFNEDVVFRQKMWAVLCHNFFQKYIPHESAILELAAGYCEFINNIKAKRKIAVDLNPSISVYANPDIEVFNTASTKLNGVSNSSIDIVWTSNFFEHLTREDIVATIQEAERVLKPGGKFLILQPNIRFCAKDYWMFFDHITPLDDRSLSEVLEVNGFRVVDKIVRFLPFTTKSQLPNSLALLKLYLKLPLAWRIFGQQSFLIAQKPPN